MDLKHKILAVKKSQNDILLASKLRNLISINSFDAYTQAVDAIADNSPLQQALLTLKNNCRRFPTWIDTARGCLLYFLNNQLSEVPENEIHQDYRKWNQTLLETYRNSLSANEEKINTDTDLTLFRHFTTSRADSSSTRPTLL